MITHIVDPHNDVRRHLIESLLHLLQHSLNILIQLFCTWILRKFFIHTQKILQFDNLKRCFSQNIQIFNKQLRRLLFDTQIQKFIIKQHLHIHGFSHKYCIDPYIQDQARLIELFFSKSHYILQMMLQQIRILHMMLPQCLQMVQANLKYHIICTQITYKQYAIQSFYTDYFILPYIFMNHLAQQVFSNKGTKISLALILINLVLNILNKFYQFFFLLNNIYLAIQIELSSQKITKLQYIYCALASIFDYQKMHVTSLTLMEKMKIAAFNFRYKMLGYLQEYDKQRIVQPGDYLYIFGEAIKVDEKSLKAINETIYKKFNETTWITYRSGFPQLYNQIVGGYVTDTGWGCMIRVGQMAFAEILRSHKKNQTPEQIKAIINLFNDCDKKQPFSIQNISLLARKQYDILPGDWYNPSQISNVLANLNDCILKEKEKLTYVIFNSGNLFYDQIIQSMLGQPYQRCKCLIPKGSVVCIKCFHYKYSAGIVILTRIGLDKPEEKYLGVLNQMMKCKFSKGMIGGKPKKALYFIGVHNENSFVYLDPHFVQKADNQIETITETYYCQSFRRCSNKSIDPSIGICYYIRNFQELNELYSYFQKLKKQYPQEMFIWSSEITPKYMKTVSKKVKFNDEEDDYFQVV